MQANNEIKELTQPVFTIFSEEGEAVAEEVKVIVPDQAQANNEPE